MRSKTVTDTISNLIMDDGYTSFERLPDSDKDELLGLQIASMGKHGYEVITEADDASEILKDFICYLLNGTPDTAVRLAETMRSNALEYLRKPISTLFDDCYSDLRYDNNINAGLHPIVDQNNGELRWIR